LAILVALTVGSLLVAAIIWPVINVVETGKTAEYPEIQPQYYTTDPQRVFEEARAGVEALEGWTLVSQNAAQHTLQAERESQFFGLIDEITVRVEPVTEFVTRVHIRSASRVGKGDFGQNARNITEFFAELDSRLGAVKLDPETLRARPLPGSEPAEDQPDASPK
jgi:uncharacterized protein (DUF1499 family)